MTTEKVITAFLVKDDKILLVKRSPEVGTYSGRWSAISGYLEKSPLQQAKTELREETGLSNEDFKLVKKGDFLKIKDRSKKRNWIVYPFRFKLVNEKPIKLNRENTEYRWVKPGKIRELKTVPNLEKTWERVQ